MASGALYASSTHAASVTSNHRTFFQQTNLVSDIPGVARFTDPNLVNSWGISHSPKGPWIVSDNGTGVATSYLGNGKAFPVGNPLVITIPPPRNSPAGTKATPTGNVFNNTDDFVISENGRSRPSKFIFATEDGTISGWNPDVDPTNAILEVDNSSSGAVYKGLAIGRNSAGKDFLYAANFHSGFVDMFDARFNLVNSFTDPVVSSTCPIDDQCFAPFGIQNIKGKIFVSFALQNAEKHDDVAGPGNGFVDVFSPNGILLQRLIMHGVLNSPWGMTLAPKDFGQFSEDLLVGNFGDGHINAFDIETGDFQGQLRNKFGKPIIIDGLWGLAFGNGEQAGPRDTLFFAAGIADEAHGLFGSIQAEEEEEENNNNHNNNNHNNNNHNNNNHNNNNHNNNNHNHR
ncbi:hypothetical protein KSZ_61160 [Dictyobacter formicarum]|uniref:TIGR03118 family protein n=2 Tax=Dictyobacter formicarum TaxID=2778368 RepID=A0ABQ3VQL6_9CHLR|nr:hypothetical protein KSZ_61160 [Dictyobacter formicarum]